MKRFNIKNIIYSTRGGTLMKCAFSNFKTTYKTSGMKALIEKRIIPTYLKAHKQIVIFYDVWLYDKWLYDK